MILSPSSVSSNISNVAPLLFQESFSVRASSGYEIVKSFDQKETDPIREPPDRGRVRLFLVRHGESIANTDTSVLTEYSDHAIPLSHNGLQQAAACGEFMKSFLSSKEQMGSRRRVWVSPYKRARDTAANMINHAGSNLFGDLKESVFLGEQQFGLFEGLAIDEIAQKYPNENVHFEKSIAHGGRFWARMPLGESRFDVVSRVSRVIDQILLDEHYLGIRDVVVVSHGITLRAFAMAWLERTAEWFEREQNPLNASVRLIEGTVDKGYIFSGFKGEKNKADKEEDLIEGVVQRSKTIHINRRATLEERMKTLQEEFEEIKSELGQLQKMEQANDK